MAVNQTTLDQIANNSYVFERSMHDEQDLLHRWTRLEQFSLANYKFGSLWTKLRKCTSTSRRENMIKELKAGPDFVKAVTNLTKMSIVTLKRRIEVSMCHLPDDVLWSQVYWGIVALEPRQRRLKLLDAYLETLVKAGAVSKKQMAELRADTEYLETSLAEAFNTTIHVLHLAIPAAECVFQIAHDDLMKHLERASDLLVSGFFEDWPLAFKNEVLEIFETVFKVPRKVISRLKRKPAYYEATMREILWALGDFLQSLPLYLEILGEVSSRVIGMVANAMSLTVTRGNLSSAITQLVRDDLTDGTFAFLFTPEIVEEYITDQADEVDRLSKMSIEEWWNEIQECVLICEELLLPAMLILWEYYIREKGVLKVSPEELEKCKVDQEFLRLTAREKGGLDPHQQAIRTMCIKGLRDGHDDDYCLLVTG
jgi:hypothetical protein